MSEVLSPEIFLSALRLSTPLIFAALAGWLSERSGTIQIALEAFMLIGAWTGAAICSGGIDPLASWMFAGFAGLALAVIMGIMVIQFQSNAVVVGMALNILAAGVCPSLSKFFFDSSGSTPSLLASQRLELSPFWMAGLLSLALIFLNRFCRWGLWIRFAGEAPQVLASAGVSPRKVRWSSLLACGFIAGLGGGTLSLCMSSSYSPMMTAGRGYIALAALIFGGWRPLPTLLACLFFGFTDALQMRLQGVDTGVPVALVQVLPYVMTLAALMGLLPHQRAPAALGRKLES